MIFINARYMLCAIMSALKVYALNGQSIDWSIIRRAPSEVTPLGLRGRTFNLSMQLRSLTVVRLVVV